MDAELKGLYARALDTPAGKCFCVVVSGPNVGEDGFDVTIFHARSMRTYVGKGLRAPPRWVKPELWMPLAIRALASEALPGGVRFNFNPETGALSWTWPGREVGMTAGAQQAVSLQLVKPLGAVVDGFGAVAISSGIAAGELGGVDHLEAMLLTVWESCHRLLLSCRQLDSQLQRQSDELSRTRGELQASTEKNKALVQELHVKFALVLDAKKAKLIEQQARIRDLEEQLKAAKQELAEAEAAHTDDEEEEEEKEDQKPPQGAQQQLWPARIHMQDQEKGSTSNAAARITAAGPLCAEQPGRVPQVRDVAGPSSGALWGAERRVVGVEQATLSGMELADGGVCTALAVAPGQMSVVRHQKDDMEWNLGRNEGLVERPVMPPPAGPEMPPERSALVAAAAAGLPLGGTYANLFSTQVDDDLLAAATLPAVPVNIPVPEVSPAGLTPQLVLLQNQQAPGYAVAGPTGHLSGFGTYGGAGPILAAIADEDDEDDDDAALGLNGRW